MRVAKTYHERVALTRKDGDLIDRQGLCVLAVGLDDSHRMTIDLERVVRVAGERHEAEAVPEVIRFRQALA